jgi:serine/threonine-protein kinase
MGSRDTPKVAVRQGGKEELRASMLKTYLLRLRAEKGDAVVRTMLGNIGVDPTVLDNETAWLSVQSARRALRALADSLGKDALIHRGEWAAHPEALGTHVRMLRTATRTLDAYRYLAANFKEITRVGTWEIEEPGDGKDASGAAGEGKPKAPAKEASHVSIKVIYRPREDSQDESEKIDAETEALFCAARQGELAGYPRIWGLGDAHVAHDACLAKGGEACEYVVSWDEASPQKNRFVIGAIGAVIAGGAVAATGGIVPGVIAMLLGGALGAGAGFYLDKSKSQEGSRTFEKNRIAALERGLDLKGETQKPHAQPGELTGTVLGGKYRIGRKIGSGGIGVVYAAEHTSLGHEVAVKVLRGAAARDGGEIARLRREAHIQAELEHPNIARVMDLDQMPDGSMYVVMERLVGRSLADKLAREHMVTPGFAIPVFIGVCRALGAAHKKGVVHRDLKPGNVFLCEDGTPKVLDFGMSKLTTAEALTQAGYTLGTPEYMAPEQCIGAAVESRTDIYALGVLMYEALTGELPISSPNRRELLDLHQRQVPTAMTKRKPELGIPEALDEIVMKCLKKKLGERPASALEVEEALLAIPTADLPLSYEERKPARPAPPPASSLTDTVARMPSEPPPAPSDPLDSPVDSQSPTKS